MKKSYILIIIFIVFILLISIFGGIIVTGNDSVKKNKDLLVVQNNKDVYFNGYGYSVDNPNIIINPYGNSPLTALVMFETDDYSSVIITIKGRDGSEDITYTLPNEKHHLVPIYGLYADYDNTVIIKSEEKEKTINIKTDKLPDDFILINNSNEDNYTFYNGNYPYAVDGNNEVRWYFNKHYYGNITVLDNSNIIIGSDRYTENDNTISFYQMNLLGKIYQEYLLNTSYYGYNTLYKDNILVLSDKLLLIDIQTGEVVDSFIDNDNYNYLGILDNDIIVGKENIYYKVSDNDLEEIEYTAPLSTFNFNIGNYKTIPSRRFGNLDETKVSNKKISLLKYDKDKVDGISIEQDSERIKITNDNDQKVYVILDKFLDKRVYEVGYIKYINTTSLRGKYTVYFKVGNKLYKTNSYVEG